MASSGAIDKRVLIVCGVLFISIFGIHGVDSVNGTTQATTSDGSSGGSTKDPLDKSLEKFYSIVSAFLDSFNTPPLTDPDSILNINMIVGKNSTDFSILIKEKWQDFLNAYKGLAACIVVGVLFIIFMPIVGLILCCCRTCCRNCRCRRNTRTDKSRCCKFSLSVTLFLVNSLILCACVFTFISGYLLREDLNPQSSRNILMQTASTVGELNSYINDTVHELVSTVLTSFVQTSDSILQSIGSTAKEAVDDVMKTVNVSSFLDQAKDLSQDVSNSLKKLEDVKDTLTTIKDLQSNLTSELSSLKTITNSIDCNNMPDASSKTSCTDLKTSIDGASVSADFSGLDTLEAEIDKVNETMDISTLVTDSEKQVTDVENTVTNDIQANINESDTQVKSLQQTVKNEVNKVEKDIQDQLQKSLSQAQTSLTDTKNSISNNSVADILYALYGIAAVVGLVCLIYYIGLLFSMFGTQKDEAENCCTYETGAGFLVAGVAITFILAWLLMIVCLLMFTVGGSIYTLVCTDFVTRNPTDLEGLESLMKEYIDFGDTIKDVSVSSMLSSCQKNEALYQALQLRQIFDPNKVIDIEQLTAEANKIQNTALNVDNITVLTPSLETKINDFKDSGLASINFTNHEAELNKDIVTKDFSALSTSAKNLANSLPDTPADVKDVKDKLNNIANKLSTLQDSNIKNIETQEGDLRNAINYLKNYSDISVKTDALIEGLKNAQDQFNTDGKAGVQTKLSELARSIIKDVAEMKHKIVYMVEYELARCKPIYNTFYGLTDIPCVTLLNHWNGYWFGLGWALAFSIPALIIALILAGLFRSDERVKAFLDDADVSGYESHGQDRIPLTSTQPSSNNDVQPYRVHDYGRGQNIQNYDNRAYRDDRDAYRQPPPEYSRNGYPEERSHYPSKPYKY